MHASCIIGYYVFHCGFSIWLFHLYDVLCLLFQIQCHPTEDNESPPLPPLVNGTVYFSETDPTHCYNF